MKQSGALSTYEEAGTSYLAAVINTKTGQLDVSQVGGEQIGWKRIALVAVADMPTAWMNTFNNASSLTVTIKVISRADSFEIFVNNELAFTYGTTEAEKTIIKLFDGTGFGVRCSLTGATVTGVQNYSELTTAQALTDEIIVTNKKEV